MNDDLQLHAPPPRLDFLSSGILVVERDDSSADMMLRFLKSAGYRNVFSVVGSGSAFDMLYELDIDLLLIDSETLISIDGRDILEKLRQSHLFKHLPIIILTSDNDRALRLRVLEHGANDILTKPVDAHEMTLRLHNTLAAKAYRDLVVYRDDVTGLPNRERYTDRLDWAIKYSLRYGIQGAVLHIDLDRFKKIVEGLGWATGDRLLRSIAKQMGACLRDTDIIARQDIREQSIMLSRLSGNEFTILLCGIARPDDAAIVAQRILEMMRTPMPLGDQAEVNTTCSIGIAVFPGDGKNTNEIISAANNAMHDVKRIGGNGFHFYSQKINERAALRLSLETDLRHALKTDELFLAYQPQVDVATGRISGAEALIRWQHPQRGLIGPNEFIPIAEESGLILPLGELIITQASRQIRHWLDKGIAVPRIALNLSPLQFAEKGFVYNLAQTLAEYRIEGQQITLEITENVLLNNIQEGIGVLKSLDAMGIKLSIDDFGTGYSSLAYLKRLPLHELKIDRSFLTGIHTDSDSAAIVSTILALGQQLRLRVVAEGVETVPQLDFLNAHRCDCYQGFLFSPAVPASEFSRLLQDASSFKQ